MHPSHELMRRMVEDPEAVLARRLEVARQSGVPEEPLRRYAAERRRRGPQPGHRRADRGPTASSSTGVIVSSDLGEWVAYETPGHAPSHVCLFQPERRLLISGDHLLGRISLYFEYGYSPDPVGEFLGRWTSSSGSARACAWPATGAPSPTCTRTSAGNRDARRRAPRRGRGGPGREPLTAFEVVAARIRRRALAAERPVAALADARLPDAPGGVGERSAHAGRARALDGAGLHNLRMRIDRDPRRRRAGVLVRVLPAEDRGGRAQPVRGARRAAPRSSRRSCRSPTAPAARRARRRSRSSSASRTSTASRRWRTSPAWARPSRAARHARRDARTRASTTCSRCAATRRPGRRSWTKTEGGLEYSRELVELISADYPFAIGAACFPETHIHATSPEADLEHLVEKVERGRRLPDHAAVLRQRLLLRLRRARARGRHHRADHPGHDADHARRPGRAHGRRCAARRSPTSSIASSTRAARTPRRCSTSASPTPRCSAPSCSPPARRASTSTRSTARPPRARS